VLPSIKRMETGCWKSFCLAEVQRGLRVWLV
jgi:hypothetical protein